LPSRGETLKTGVAGSKGWKNEVKKFQPLEKMETK